MATGIRVRVKSGQRGFIYGTLRHGATHSDKGKLLVRADEFTLIDVEYTHKKDANGKPLIKKAEQQFSDVWMERIEKTKAVIEPDPVKTPDDMTVKELKVALIEADVDVPNGTVKEDLIKLLKDSQTDPE